VHSPAERPTAFAAASLVAVWLNVVRMGWVVALAEGCVQPRTEIVVRVESEVAWGVGRTVQSVVLTVRRGSATGPLRSARSMALGAEAARRTLPLYVGLLPAVDSDALVWIEALGCADPNGCTVSDAVVAQRAVVAFARGETLEVPLLLASACVGVTCASDQRCAVGGRCEAATRATVGPFVGATPDAAIAVDAPTDGDIAEEAVADAPPADRNDLGASADGVDASTDTGPICGPLEGVCGGACVALLLDPEHCGACGRHCPSGEHATPSCNGGRCELICATGFLACLGGVCQDVRSDVANCGACGLRCPGGDHGLPACAAGRCVLDCSTTGYADCDGDPANGCESALGSDPSNCGGCGRACEAGQRCALGMCRN